MTAHNDDQGAALQPQDDLAAYRGCVVASCISAALWIAIGAAVYAWWMG